MDPKACLAQCELNLSNSENAEALRDLFNYFQWRLSGGFQPSGDKGDAWALLALDTVADLMEGEKP